METENMVKVTFTWSAKHGRCYDCSLPAAFYAPTRYGKLEPPTDENKLCAVCAANEASEGIPIKRIEPLEY